MQATWIWPSRPMPNLWMHPPIILARQKRSGRQRSFWSGMVTLRPPLRLISIATSGTPILTMAPRLFSVVGYNPINWTS